MNQLSKIVITVVISAVFLLLFSLIMGVRSDAGASTPGIVGLALFAGLISALRAVWKKQDDNQDDDKNDTSVLQD